LFSRFPFLAVNHFSGFFFINLQSDKKGRQLMSHSVRRRIRIDKKGIITKIFSRGLELSIEVESGEIEEGRGRWKREEFKIG